MKNLYIVVYTILFLFFTGCGFKVLDQNQLKNFKILEVKEQGDKKINFFIKNELYRLVNVNDSANELKIVVKSEKIKSIKEKNKKNQITKYNIKINYSIEINFVNKNKSRFINLSEENFYNVNLNHNITRNNQKNVEENLIDKISQNISIEMLKIINEL